MSSWAQYPVQLHKDLDHSEAMSRLKAEGIPSMIYYINPMHRQKAFENTYSSVADCPVTEEICDTVMSLSIDPYKTEIDIKKITNALKNII